MHPDISGAPVKVKMRRSTKLELPAIPNLPDRLVIRRAQMEEAGGLAALCGRAYENEIWDTQGTENELFRDNTVIAVLVVAEKDQLLSTASLQADKMLSNSCQIRWVATEQTWRRQGLARALIVSLLDMAKKAGRDEVHLQTTTDLLGAIAMYLQLGFEPVLSCNRERDVWKKVFSLLQKTL